MKEIEQLMKEVPASFVICDKSNVTKNMVLKEIMKGEKEVSSIKNTLGICDDKGCENRVEALLKTYLPIYDIIFDGKKCGQHNHASSESTCDPNSCGSCPFDCKK